MHAIANWWGRVRQNVEKRNRLRNALEGMTDEQLILYALAYLVRENYKLSKEIRRRLAERIETIPEP